MSLDTIHLAQLDERDRQILRQGPDVLVVISQMGTAMVYFATEQGDAVLSGIAGVALHQWHAAAIEAGVVVVDARPCDPDAYLDRMVHGPMVAVGPGKARLIDGTRGALSYLDPQDYARGFAAIGAIVHNVAPARRAAA